MSEQLEPEFEDFINCVDALCKEYGIEITYIAHTKADCSPTLFGNPLPFDLSRINVVRRVTKNFDPSVLDIWKEDKNV